MGKTFFSCEVFPLGMLNRRLNVNVSKSLERLTLYQPPLPMRAHTSTCTHTRGQSPLQISARAPRLFGDEGTRRRQSWGHRGPASPPATFSLPAAPPPALGLGDAAGCRGSRGPSVTNKAVPVLHWACCWCCRGSWGCSGHGRAPTLPHPAGGSAGWQVGGDRPA